MDPLLFSGSSHPSLALEIASHLKISLGKIKLGRFPDGEIEVQILENVRGRDVFILQSVALDPNNHLMELLIILDALKRASARSAIAVIPYYGYCRQDRKDKPRVPITAKLVADLLTQAGADRILTMDLHAGQVQGFFNIPVDNLFGRAVLAPQVKKWGIPVEPQKFVVVAPDIGSVKIARAYAAELGVDFAVVDKHRQDASHIESVTLIGNVNNKDVLLADDMCSTGGTLASAAKACREKGATRVFAAVTHGLFVDDALEKIEASSIDAVLTSNTVPMRLEASAYAHLHVFSIAPLFAAAIRCVLRRESISSLFEKPKS